MPRSGDVPEEARGLIVPNMTETIADFSQRIRALEALACPTTADKPYFQRQMKLAPGATYPEALEYVVRMRQSSGLESSRMGTRG